MDGHEYLVDVYVPGGYRPYLPVVVALHGASAYKSDPTNEEVAKAAAEAGTLVFAQQEAAGYGGDSNRSVVYGYSGGGAAGAMFVFGPTRDLPTGCLDQTPPVGAVLGDAEYFNFPDWRDGAFDKDIEEMQTIVAETIDPAIWTAELPTRVRLWAAADGSFPRSFDDPWDEGGWLAQRDPVGL